MDLCHQVYGWGNDTCWVKTWDGNTPQVHIFHEGNFIRGSYVTVRDWDCRNVGYAVEALSGSTYTNMIVRNISTHNTPSVAIFLTGNYVDCVVDSCTVDSTGYTAIYDQFGRNNAFRYDTVTNAVQTIMGCPINGAEICGIGFQQDTNCVCEYSSFTNCYNAGFDTYYNVNDTVRYNTFSSPQDGVYLNGTGWVCYNNTITETGSSTGIGIRVDIHGTGQTSAYNNTITSYGSGQTFGSSEPGGGTCVFHNNNITLIGPTNTRFDDFQITTGVTSTNNSFRGTAVFNAGLFPNEHLYNTLASFHATTGYENGSTPLVAYFSPVKQINFGLQKLGQPKDTTATMTNEGGDTLKITAITSTNSAFSPRPTIQNIAYQEPFVDTIRFTPTSFGGFSGNILIKSNDTVLSSKPDTIAVIGTSPYPKLIVNQSSLNFGNVAHNTPKPLTIQITDSSINTLSVDSIYTKTSLFVVNKTKDSVSTSDSVVITFTPAVFGSFTDTLYLRNNSTSALIKVPLSGTSPTPTLGLNQLSLNFGNVARDSSKQQMLQISNSTVNLLTIDSIYTKTSVFKVSKTNISIPAIDSIAVTFSPLAVAGFTDTLYLRNNSTSALVKVPLTGNCPSPLLISSQSGIFFSNRALQDSAIITVYARNASVIPLSISNITTTNSAFTVSPKTAGISGFDSTALRIVFKPVLFGTVIDTMTVISDAGVVKVPLSGTSPYPVINVNKSAINFGLVAASDSNYQAILISNTSINKLRIDSSYTTNSIFVSSIRNAVVADSLNALILCYSKNAGVYSDTLYLRNNSATPLLKVPIGVKLYSKPGRPQSPRISPNRWTNTATDTVSWSISQAGMLTTPVAWYSLDTVPSSPTTLLSRPIANNSFVVQMNKVGTHTVYFFLQDSLGNKNPDSTGFVIARFDTTAPAIQYDSTKFDTVVVQQDGSINTVPPITAGAVKPSYESGVASMQLNYRRINDISSSSLPFPAPISPNSSLMLPASAFSSGGTTIGVDYQIQATDSAGNTSATGFFSL